MENFPGNCIYIFLSQRLILATADLRKNFSSNIVAILLFEFKWNFTKFYFFGQNIFKFKQYCRNVAAILFNIPAMFRNLVAIFRQYCLSIRCYGGWRLNTDISITIKKNYSIPLKILDSIDFFKNTFWTEINALVGGNIPGIFLEYSKSRLEYCSNIPEIFLKYCRNISMSAINFF